MDITKGRGVTGKITHLAGPLPRGLLTGSVDVLLVDICRKLLVNGLNLQVNK